MVKTSSVSRPGDTSQARIFCDTSVLVAAVQETHEHHRASRRVVDGVTRGTAYCALHSIAELYVTLTRARGSPVPVAPSVGSTVIDGVIGVFAPVSLTAKEYQRVIQTLAAQQIAGAQLYDALILECAEKCSADVVYTWNMRHFQTLAPSTMRDKIRAPI